MTEPAQPALTAADVMTPRPRTCSPFSSVLEASMLFRAADCGVVPVVDGGQPIGILTDRDVALAVAENPDLASRPVSQFMSKDIISVLPDSSLETVAAKLREHALHRVLVVDDAGQLQGIIGWADLATHVSEASLGQVVGDVVEKP